MIRNGTPKTLGGRLKHLLKEDKKTQKWLAELLKVHINTVTQWCNDLRSPSVNTLREISTFFQIDYNWLITGETPEQYAARWQAKKEVLRVTDGSADYEKIKEELQDIFEKIILLSPEDRCFIKQMVDKLLGGEREK